MFDDLPDKEQETMPWDFSMGTMDEETKKRAWIPFAADTYVARCENMVMIMKKGYMTDVLEPQIEMQFKLLKTVEGDEIKNADGQPAKNDLVTIWCSPFAVALNRKTGQPQKTRAILTALLGLAPNAALASPKPEDFIGKKLKMVCAVGLKPDGTRKNAWSNFAPYNKPDAPTA